MGSTRKERKKSILELIDEEVEAENRKGIKPCPFCGSRGEVTHGIDYYSDFQVYCTNLDCGAIICHRGTAEETALLWQKRTPLRSSKKKTPTC